MTCLVSFHGNAPLPAQTGRTTMSAEARLKELKLVLPPPPKPIGNYVPFRIGGGLLFLSGAGPRGADGSNVTGKVGDTVTVEQAYQAARNCGLNLLANMRDAL